MCIHMYAPKGRPALLPADLLEARGEVIHPEGRRLVVLARDEDDIVASRRGGGFSARLRRECRRWHMSRACNQKERR